MRVKEEWISTGSRCLRCVRAYLGVDHLHDGLLELLKSHGVLGRGSSDDVVLVVGVAAELSVLLRVRKLDVDAKPLHDLQRQAKRDCELERPREEMETRRTFCMFFPPTPMILLW